MKITFISLCLMLFLAFSPTVFSANAATQLGTCMIDNLNGKERKNLAKWVFFAMGAHPEISQFLNSDKKTKQKSDQFVGVLITRLLTTDCGKQARNAVLEDPMALQKAFELVGQVAMQELMTNKDVMQSLTDYVRYSDQEKLNKIFSGT